jgi:hypothetical protein
LKHQQNTHSSSTRQKWFLFVNTSYNCSNRGCCKFFIISISFWTSNLSWGPFTSINFAASSRPVFRSLHCLTSPNLPLWRKKIIYLCIRFDFQHFVLTYDIFHCFGLLFLPYTPFYLHIFKVLSSMFIFRLVYKSLWTQPN